MPVSENENHIIEDAALPPVPVTEGPYSPVYIEQSDDNTHYIKKQALAIQERPDGRTFEEFQAEIHQRYPSTLTSNHAFQLAGIHNSVKSNYNYTSKAYESFVERLDEKEIPNFYLSSDEIRDIEAYQDYRGFNSNIGETLFKEFGQDGKYRFNYRSEESIDQFENLLFGSDFDLIFFEEYKEVFPWVNRLEFTSPHNTDFFDLIRRVGVYEYLINDYLSGKKMQGDFNLTPKSAVDRPQIVTYEIFDMFEWSKSLPFVLQEEDRLIVSRGFRSQSSYRRNFGKLVIAGRLRSLSRDKVRSIKQLHEGELADYEACFYKVEKFIGDVAGQPVQSFWLPPGTDVIKYYDSQVKVDKIYSYLVKGYFLVYGTEYSHSVTFSDPAGSMAGQAEPMPGSAAALYPPSTNFYEATVEAACSPSFKIVEIPLFTDQTYVAQDPPMIPFVSFHNETNSTNNIEIFLNLTPGMKTEEFITIESEDQDQVEKLDILNDGGTPVFSFTSEPGLFEVYRLSEPPLSHSDFLGNKLGEVRNEIDSSSILFREYLTSNKKYYYMFRAINSFGLKSNPTPIYEVELIRDADSSRVDVQAYEFPEVETSQPTLKFQQLMQITPAIQHVIVDESQPSMSNMDSLGGSLNKIILGLSDNKLWGKTFKVRVTSTSSGKKFDLNLKFNVKKNKTTEDFG
tara:strand:+ start:4550 stop:6589 length:2040 start_codon:yes stop_codon:yes gene_type:complete